MSINGGVDNFILFRLNRRSYQLSRDNLNMICCFLCQDYKRKLFQGEPWSGSYAVRETVFTNSICKYAPPGDKDKSVTIIHPALRYLQKLTTVSIQGEPDISKITRADT